jgi:hypothetical protein
MQEWGEAAHAEAEKWRHRSPERHGLWMLAEHVYEALRIVVNSKQEALELAMQYLKMTRVLDPLDPGPFSYPTVAAVDQLRVDWARYGGQFRRFEHLREALLAERAKRGDALHAIIFVQVNIVPRGWPWMSAQLPHPTIPSPSPSDPHRRAHRPAFPPVERGARGLPAAGPGVLDQLARHADLQHQPHVQSPGPGRLCLGEGTFPGRLAQGCL